MRTLFVIVMLAGLIGCSATKPESHLADPVVRTDTSLLPKPVPLIDCYHSSAPELAKLEKRVGLVTISERPEEAAKWDDPEKLRIIWAAIK